MYDRFPSEAGSQKMDSDSSQDCNLMPAAFIVDQIPDDFDPSHPPASAEEYLQSVIYEARQCKRVVTADIDRKKLRKLGPVVQLNSCVRTPDGPRISKEDQDEVIKNYNELHNRILEIKASKKIPKPPTKLPGSKQSSEWALFCFGSDFEAQLIRKSPRRAAAQCLSIPGHPPLLSTVLNINPVTLENLLEWQGIWIDTVGFTEEQGQWIYSLLALLQKPLSPDVCASLRLIAQLCLKVRANLNSQDKHLLQHLNAIICIVACCFHQHDLLDK